MEEQKNEGIIFNLQKKGVGDSLPYFQKIIISICIKIHLIH